MSQFTNYKLILEELDHTLSHVQDEQYDRFANDVNGAQRIFTAGKGRSGFMANSFAMRLNQLGKEAFVVGESTTPSIKEHDLFVILSGSGSTEHLRLLAEKAQSLGAKVVLLTTSPDSPIGELAETVIELPAGTKYNVEGSEQPLGSLFEQSSLLFLDSVVLGLMETFDISEEEMQNNHANLE
ncbi:6-phospho-3-hexuloisomerase [Staphylococcus haemolyticus]|uniref:6-phospho-3-hexuloisomerase n=1 Tax=Staphylococcus haemolyticus TaxID=1283 RepID=UPI00290289A3|nr:6-phospho-3-hexuloisomerase [Staphylococcus haemolyticus]MDU0569122.1 6-phospho-3-hexuloisomerase [Staphylococcus haemolyticus]